MLMGLSKSPKYIMCKGNYTKYGKRIYRQTQYEGFGMILLSNSVYDRVVSNSYNSIARSKSDETDAQIKASQESASFDEEAATLEISKEGIRRLSVNETENNHTSSYYREAKAGREENFNIETGSADEDDDVENVLARIQKYMSRSLQLEQESQDTKLTQAQRRTIQNEINKINLVVNNLSSNSSMDVTELMANSIQMDGDLVNHSSRNILNNAADAIYAQGAVRNADALALLA